MHRRAVRELGGRRVPKVTGFSPGILNFFVKMQVTMTGVFRQLLAAILSLFLGGWQALNRRARFGCRTLRFLKRAGCDDLPPGSAQEIMRHQNLLNS